MSTKTRERSWQGPAVLSYGFRPFFLAAGIYAALLILLWVPWFLGLIAIPTALPPAAWHGHELLFGFLPAVMAGFLLTAVPNWTGRLPVVGWPLRGLVALWLIGRAAIFLSLTLPPLAVAAATIAMPLALALVIGREIVAGRNWRNLKILAILAMLISVQALFHIELRRTGNPAASLRLAVAVAIMLIMMIGGRIIPSFTSSWLRPRGPGALPVPFNRGDGIALVLSGAALAGWFALALHRCRAAAGGRRPPHCRPRQCLASGALGAAADLRRAAGRHPTCGIRLHRHRLPAGGPRRSPG